jgi:hypothetical protein
MICADCKQAGIVMKLKPNEAHPAPKREAEALHAKCAERDQTYCDCQHRVNENLINLGRIPNADTNASGEP